MAPAKGAGKNLSSGEKQNIARVRIILRNSPLLIFDEFTRSIDVESKKSILSVIRQLNDKTIIITHDTNDIEEDGRIVVLEREGTPSQNPVIIPPVTEPEALPLGGVFLYPPPDLIGRRVIFPLVRLCPQASWVLYSNLEILPSLPRVFF